jgi:V/A-type H+-transporting ATPase subunit I
MIVPMVKVTVYGFLQDKERVLAGLQEIGCLHLIPLRPEGNMRKEDEASPRGREALKFLLSCRQRRRQVRHPTHFDPASVAEQARDLQRRMQTLRDERDFLRRRIMDLGPWGDFTFPPLENLKNLRLWFYTVPHNEMEKVESIDLPWEIVDRDNRFSYVVVVSEEEPEGMPVSRTRTGSKSLSELERRLEEVELELEDLQAERSSLTRWCYLLARSLYRLEDEAQLAEAVHQTHDEGPLFALQAWAPSESIEELQAYAGEMRLALEVEYPGPGEIPPTLLHNQPTLAGGQDLVTFYMTPSYWYVDPSTLVFFSFALFFAMILGDVGYGSVLGLGLLLGWRRMGSSDLGRRLRVLFAALIGATIGYGVLVGSYFGMTPAEGTPSAALNILDLNDYSVMMRLSILIGVAHLVLANTVDAWRQRRSTGALAPIGWIAILVGAIVLWLGGGPSASVGKTGIFAMGGGAIAVLLFTSVEEKIGKRLVKGALGLTRISGAFGDVLSYLRLFALGLATSSLAAAFNGLADQVGSGIRGFGILLALLVLLIGHGLNFTLAIMSGFIHGLRLNFIEFFNWSISEEGYPFRAFARKETSSWNR